MSDPCITLLIGSLVADGATPDGSGIVWTVQRIDGWFDSTAVRVVTQEVEPVGEVATLVREQARAIVAQLVAHAAVTTDPLGSTLCYTAIDTCEAAFACVYASRTFEVIDPVLDLHAQVRRVGPVQHKILGASAAVRFQVSLLAEDPYRYDSLDNPFD